MNFSKIFFKVNVILGCTLVSNNSKINLEEDDEIKEMIKKYVKSKNFLKKNLPLVIRLLESNYSYVSKNGINSIVNKLNINFKEEQINSKDHLDKSGCIKEFKKYVSNTYDKMSLNFGKLIVKKFKSSGKVELDSSKCLSYAPEYCINEFLVSLKKNQCDIRFSNNESLLEIYMDFLSMHEFYIDVIRSYEEFRFLIIPIIKIKKRMLSSEVFKNKSVLNSSEFDGIYSPEIKEYLCEKVLDCILRMNKRNETSIEEYEKFKNYWKEFSKKAVEIIILIEKYNNSYNNNLTSFTIDSCIFKYLDNNNNSLKKEIQQLYIKLSNNLLKESKRYNMRLYTQMGIFYNSYSSILIPLSFYEEIDGVLENYEEVENDQGNECIDEIEIIFKIMNGYDKVLLILFNPSLTRYLID
ncbi:hypothetical protein A0H76_1950 [Hepatospora eriocheir]|uniref:Uncharacterized protein n=1 Tax=Hepatospora eriocheir TaxID=1081669 RepID=A0A1X0QKH4_9MICR|nr:hypothetical protein A0H76_1950 [Hepatospora eriocheir]